jgi:hypothetical protein
MSIRDAFNKAFRKMMGESSSSSSSSSSKRMVPRYPDTEKIMETIEKPELTNAQKAEQEIKEYFVPKHLREYAQDVRDYVAAKKEEPKKYNPDTCDPKTCWGECMGEGWCHIAQEWHKVMHRHKNFNTFVILKKKKGKMSKKKRKRLKSMWKKRHNR